MESVDDRNLPVCAVYIFIHSFYFKQTFNVTSQNLKSAVGQKTKYVNY